MKNNKRYVRICAALLCAVLCLSVNVAPAMAAKVTQADIDALKGNAASLDKKQKEIQSKLNSLKNDKAAAVQKKTLLDDQIANTNAKISTTMVNTMVETVAPRSAPSILVKMMVPMEAAAMFTILLPMRMVESSLSYFSAIASTRAAEASPSSARLFRRI